MEIKTLESEDKEDICCHCGGDLVQPDLTFEPDYVAQIAADLVCVNCGEVFYESDRRKPDKEDFWLKLGNCTEIIEMASTPARLYILVAQLQLALRHPDNNGASAEIAREIALNMTEAICRYVPEARESIEQGWNPAYDATRDYFDAEFHLGSIIQNSAEDFDE